eukprot:6898812-Prymnesium_polylepis.1
MVAWTTAWERQRRCTPGTASVHGRARVTVGAVGATWWTRRVGREERRSNRHACHARVCSARVCLVSGSIALVRLACFLRVVRVRS